MTISEEIFDKYLSNRHVKYTVEKGKLVHPDRSLKTVNGLVICEIHQLEGKSLPTGKLIVTNDPYKKIRKAIKRKVRQGKEAKDKKIPYVIVLFNYNTPQIMSDAVVEAAMYGDMSIVIDLSQDVQKKGKVRGSFFAANGILRRAKNYKDKGYPLNKRVSAVAILDVINPSESAFNNKYKKSIKGLDPISDIDKISGVTSKVMNRLIKKKRYKLDSKIPRLRVFHNFYACTPLKFDIFNGKRDIQYFIDPITGQHRQYKP